MDKIKADPAEKGEIETRYHFLSGFRSAPLERAYQCAELTIPSVLPRAGTAESSDLPLPYQSLGARGSQNVASQIMLANLSPTRPVMRLDVDPAALAPGEEVSTQIQEDLQVWERKIMSKMALKHHRASLFNVILLMVITGAPAAYLSSNYGLRPYRMDQFVVDRQPDGTLLETITEDVIDVLSLPSSVVEADDNLRNLAKSEDPRSRRVKLYTQCIHTAYLNRQTGEVPANVPLTQDGTPNMDTWTIRQEVLGVRLPVERVYFASPFLAPRWNQLTGERWARSLVEEVLGDLRSYEGLQKALVEASAIASRVKGLVNTVGGFTNINDLNNPHSPNGAFIAGRDQDISFVTFDKILTGMQVTQAMAQTIEKRLSYSFLLETDVQPTGERVTATQIRRIARQLEAATGGASTAIGHELIQPLVEAVMEQMIRDGELPEEIRGVAKPVVLTGFDALGREQDLYNLDLFVGSLQRLSPEAVSRVNVEDYAKRVGIAMNMNLDGLVVTEEEYQAKMAQQQASQQAIQSAGSIAETQAASMAAA